MAETGSAFHPEYCGLGIGSALLEWAEEKAKGSSNDAPVEVKTVLQNSIYEREHDAIDDLSQVEHFIGSVIFETDTTDN